MPVTLPDDPSPGDKPSKKTILYNTTKKKATGAAVSSKKSKFLLQADEGERLNCLIKLTLDSIVVTKALAGEEDSYSV